MSFDLLFSQFDGKSLFQDVLQKSAPIVAASEETNVKLVTLEPSPSQLHKAPTLKALTQIKQSSGKKKGGNIRLIL